MAKLLLVLILSAPFAALAQPLAAPGDMLLRHDLQLLNDSGATDIPLTAWPLSNGDIVAALDRIDTDALPASAHAAYARTRDRVRFEMDVGAVSARFGLSASIEPRTIRSFENTPRDEGELNANVSWLGDRFSLNFEATAVANPFDGDGFRPDGTYVGVALGNWMLTAGWQDRWWGPSRDGSLVHSTNARPSPGISIQRNVSAPFETKWLSWLGPWTLSSFMAVLDDERSIEDAQLFGVRGTFRPPNTGLEIGISRTAQWCGDGRPCGLGTFADLLLGNDNRGVNVAPADEPGNQLGGFDIRWRLSKGVPLALYMQWIGEDGRGGGGSVGSWMRQLGAEHWGTLGGLDHHTHIEISDSMCREGGFGFSDEKPNCAYEHGVYRSGYRYRGRVIGHPTDGDGLSYSFGSTLVQSGGQSWNISLRHMKINRLGPPNPRHTLSATPQKIFDMQITHKRQTGIGHLSAGLGFSDADDSDVSAFVQWSSR